MQSVQELLIYSNQRGHPLAAAALLHGAKALGGTLPTMASFPFQEQAYMLDTEPPVFTRILEYLVSVPKESEHESWFSQNTMSNVRARAVYPINVPFPLPHLRDHAQDLGRSKQKLALGAY